MSAARLLRPLPLPPIVVVVLVAAVGCGGSGTTTVTAPAPASTPTAQASAPNEAPVGRAITTQGGGRAAALSVRRGATPNGIAAGAERLRPGHEWVVVTMRIANVGTDPIADDTSSIFLLGTDDAVYRSSCCNAFPGELGDSAFTLAPGQARKGVIAFQVPKTAKLASVTWEPQDTTPPVVWTIRS